MVFLYHFQSLITNRAVHIFAIATYIPKKASFCAIASLNLIELFWQKRDLLKKSFLFYICLLIYYYLLIYYFTKPKVTSQKASIWQEDKWLCRLFYVNYFVHCLPIISLSTLTLLFHPNVRPRMYNNA